MKEITESGQTYVVSDNYPARPFIKYLKKRFPLPETITTRTIWERMTDAEIQALLEYTGAGEYIRDKFLQELAMYDRIRKDNARLNDYFDKMQAAGIIAEGRKTEILK